MVSLRSDVTRKVLQYFFINPNDSLYINELSRKLKLDKRNLVKKIKQLEAENILKHETRGNLKLYSINRKYPLYKEYKGIVTKTEGVEPRLKEILLKVKGVLEAYIYGSFAKRNLAQHSDIDLMVVGTHNIVGLQRELNKFQGEIGREINVVNIGKSEFYQKIKQKDPFIKGILKGKYIKLI